MNRSPAQKNRAAINRNFQSLEILARAVSNHWKLFLIASLLTGSVARGEPPASAVELVKQARAKIAEKKIDDALALAKAAVQADPAYVDGWKQQGRAQMLRHDFIAAQSSFDTVISLWPGDADIPVWRLEMLIDMNLAKELAARLEEKDDTTLARAGDAFVARALGLILENEFGDDAEKLAKRWSRIAPKETSRAAAKMIIATIHQDFAAIPAAGANIAAKELTAVAMYRFGKWNAQNGKAAEAATAFRRAAEIWPDFVPAAHALAEAEKPKK